MSRPGFAPYPSLWDDVIEGYCLHMSAAGMRTETVYLRRAQLSQLARGLGVPIEALTVRYSWKPPTRVGSFQIRLGT